MPRLGLGLPGADVLRLGETGLARSRGDVTGGVGQCIIGLVLPGGYKGGGGGVTI